MAGAVPARLSVAETSRAASEPAVARDRGDQGMGEYLVNLSGAPAPSQGKDEHRRTAGGLQAAWGGPPVCPHARADLARAEHSGTHTSPGSRDPGLVVLLADGVRGGT
ncbi:hypothetical protein GCM10023226_32250 [Nocardioides nanhaiensis]|uniref:PPM-type phosphatase domain-containing protein n=1 Tax=Nocardioides nanhaiensis TaxID=1476871 RepID=A0ABP8WNF8_9ACTN